MKLQIAVIGSGKASGEELSVAESVGRGIARAGHVLICGGLGGVMEAASRGAKAEGGLTVGILPGESKDEANRYIDVRIVTAMSHGRNAIIAWSSDALIAVGGEAGTLSEIALALKMGKPVITIRAAPPRYPVSDPRISSASTPPEAVELAVKRAQEEV